MEHQSPEALTQNIQQQTLDAILRIESLLSSGIHQARPTRRRPGSLTSQMGAMAKQIESGRAERAALMVEFLTIHCEKRDSAYIPLKELYPKFREWSKMPVEQVSETELGISASLAPDFKRGHKRFGWVLCGWAWKESL